MTKTAPRSLAAWSASGRARDGVSQLSCALLVWLVYTLVVFRVPVDQRVAEDHGRDLLAAEQALHIDIERGAQTILLHNDFLGAFAAWEYATAYIVTTFVVLGLSWWRRGPEYPWVRNVLAWTTLIGIACFALWPACPPRLLPDGGFVDIVLQHRPPLSWGNSNVSAAADEYAAIPSLHTAWAVWVGAVALRVERRAWAVPAAVVHLSLTIWVVVATGNHYLLDVFAGIALVLLAMGLERVRVLFWSTRRPARSARMDGDKVAAPDEFFLHVETPNVQQPVGGYVLLDSRQAGGPLDLAAIRRLVAQRLPRMPRFEQRLVSAGTFRHARWVRCDVDLDDHVLEYRLLEGAGEDGRVGLANLVARLAEQELDRSRPMWQIWFVPDVGPGETAAIAIMHHSFADGLGVVDILRSLFDPVLPVPDLSAIKVPSLPVRLAATATGLIALAADGGAQQLPFVLPLSGKRIFTTALTPMLPVRELAKRSSSRVTDVLLAATGEVIADILHERGAATEGLRLRAAVPVTTRMPAPDGTGRSAQPGNLTAALRLDVPLAPMSFSARLAATSRAAERKRRSGRALATTFVVKVIGLAPPGLHRRAARAMYRGRFFNAIVSNMPGPTAELRMAGAPIRDVYPILPLAENVPLGVGTLGWNGQFCVSVIADSEVLPEAVDFASRLVQVIERAVAVAGVESASVPVAGFGTVEVHEDAAGITESVQA